MGYKVFLVEDEIVTREGIRENVDWDAAGCELCGEAPDGEAALPLIESTKPDILITDIKMPFMDGLQLSRIIRKHMPWTKIIILSGHDEFEYAQKALQIGVTEYLLKPITSEDLHQALDKITNLLDQETEERKYFLQLQKEAVENLETQREKFLLRLLMGGVTSAEAIERSQHLGFEIISPFYQVFIIKLVLTCDGSLFDYPVYEQVGLLIKEIIESNKEILFTKNGLDQYIFILKGASEEQIQKNGIFWSELINREIVKKNICQTVVKFGSIQQRLRDLHLSFAKAFVDSQSDFTETISVDTLMEADYVQSLKSEREELETFFKFGDLDEYERFISKFLQNIPQVALKSSVFRNFLIVDILLTVLQFLNDLDPEGKYEMPNSEELKRLIDKGVSIDETMGELQTIITNALKIRDEKVGNEHLREIRKAKEYIDHNYSDPELKMNHVARDLNMSSGYFSSLFSQNFGKSFRDYLRDCRLNHAMELLRTTNKKITEIANLCGYNDTHYFSTIFKRNVGFTPKQFRENQVNPNHRELP